MKLQLANLPSGFLVEITNKINEKGIKSCYYMTIESSGEDMKQITDLLEKGIIKSHMAEAHLQIESGHTVDKIVITL